MYTIDITIRERNDENDPLRQDDPHRVYFMTVDCVGDTNALPKRSFKLTRQECDWMNFLGHYIRVCHWALKQLDWATRYAVQFDGECQTECGARIRSYRAHERGQFSRQTKGPKNE